jgi:hypothetical protein
MILTAAAIGLAFGTTAFAESMTKSEYKAAQENIKAGYMSAAAACEPFVANAKDICLAEAKGREGVQLAELKEKNHPGRKAHYRVRIAIADSEYGTAKEKCDDMAGNAKDVCVKEAKAAYIAAKADAVAQSKVTAAKKTAKEKTIKARSEAHDKIIDAKQDAAAEKNNAEYKVALEKCDALTGSPKEVCVRDAKMHYGKS